MRELFNVCQAAKMIIVDMIKLDMSFNKAWENYNNKLFNNKLTEQDKDQTCSFILDILNKQKS